MRSMAIRLIPILLLLWGAATAVHADVPIGQARRLIEQGEILPLERVIAMLQKQRPGHAIEVELDPAGRVWELDVDARSGQLLKHGRDD
jgi:uncharacterized membrane protein YkoI